MVVNGYLLAAIGSKKFGAVNGCFKKSLSIWLLLAAMTANVY